MDAPVAIVPITPSQLAELGLEFEHTRHFADASTAPATRAAYARE